MSIEKQVTSLELSKQLRGAGYEQEGIWWWVTSDFNDKTLAPKHIDTRICRRLKNGFCDIKEFRMLTVSITEAVVAPTVAELGLRLPDFYKLKAIMYWKKKWKRKMVYFCQYRIDNECIEADTEADCRAKMWLHLKKEGLL